MPKNPKTEKNPLLGKSRFWQTPAYLNAEFYINSLKTYIKYADYLMGTYKSRQWFFIGSMNLVEFGVNFA